MLNSIIIHCNKCGIGYNHDIKYEAKYLLRDCPYVCKACGSSDINVTFSVRQYREDALGTSLAHEY